MLAVSGERSISIQVDFETLGIKPKGELFERASKVLDSLPAWNNRSFRLALFDDLPKNAAYELLVSYVRCQEVIFKHYGIHTERWQARRLVDTFINACLRCGLRRAIEFRDHIEDAANTLDLHSVALAIIREYETYCSQKAGVDKHVEAQRRLIDSKREEFLIALEKRDGLFCNECESLGELRIDHVEPLSLGGFSVLHKLQILCSFCNGRKCNRTMYYLSGRKDRPQGITEPIDASNQRYETQSHRH
ncbi:MAG TPA: hypothetical protein DC054_11605 [Blastocatellia bacterium]|nr:hypothetical protein [Blastocatellia bacterium]